jgi:RHS repeat-associated protein
VNRAVSYVYDGHGSTRALADPSGAVTDTYDYDAFGNLVHSTATGIPPGGTTVTATPNEFLFAGEQFDSDLNLYYNRARYLNVSTERFWTMDDYEGDDQKPLSLHKYLYAEAGPVDQIDPSGRLPVSNAVYGNIVHQVIEGDFLNYLRATGQNGTVEDDISSILGKNVPLGCWGWVRSYPT